MKKRDPISIFKNALRGCAYAFSTQPNFLIHLSISVLIIILSFWLQIPFERFLVLILVIIFCLTIEMANTALEAVVDLVTLRFHPQAKIAKDVAAGMMLVAAFGAVILGTLILLPPLWEKIFRYI
jgi:undecaprenol kinase/diacylglycerol kinase (ATP)